MSARYDSFSINRGLPAEIKRSYFTQEGNVWVFDQNLKKKVKFKKFNLQDNFLPLGMFDIILCRYVTIYFSDDFKKTVFAKIARALNPKGILILGATESLRGYSDDFDIKYINKALINVKK